MTNSATQLVWFKRDLRCVDHAPLVQAAEAGDVLGLYLFEPSLWQQVTADARHLAFITRSVNELQRDLAEIGVPLLIRVGEATDVLQDVASRLGSVVLWSHEETTDLAGYERDRRVRAWARQDGVAMHELPGRGVIRRLDTRDGWSKRWQRYMDQPILAAPTQARAAAHGLESDPIPTAASLGLAPDVCSQAQVGGRAAGLQVLESFLAERAEPYIHAMSSPVTAFEHSSRLSPYLAYGCVSARECFQASRARRSELADVADRGRWLKSLRAFETRLRWRDHFTQKLEDQPTLEIEAMHPMFDELRPDFDHQKFEALRTGRTGYPMVDACMRCTTTTGWLNFRMRAMLVSFASYHLWLDWRPVADLFARLWTDYEPGIHFPQHQMQAGVTGINAIRIYSPTKQVLDHDPTGVFIRHWVPELADVPDEFLAEPSTMTPHDQERSRCRIGVDYPEPIVDHQERYKAANAAVRELKKLPEAKRISEQVLARHGSRKKPSSRRRR